MVRFFRVKTPTGEPLSFCLIGRIFSFGRLA